MSDQLFWAQNIDFSTNRLLLLIACVFNVVYSLGSLSPECNKMAGSISSLL